MVDKIKQIKLNRLIEGGFIKSMETMYTKQSTLNGDVFYYNIDGSRLFKYELKTNFLWVYHDIWDDVDRKTSFDYQKKN
jgi:hypothetical protein